MDEPTTELKLPQKAHRTATQRLDELKGFAPIPDSYEREARIQEHVRRIERELANAVQGQG